MLNGTSPVGKVISDNQSKTVSLFLLLQVPVEHAPPFLQPLKTLFLLVEQLLQTISVFYIL